MQKTITNQLEFRDKELDDYIYNQLARIRETALQDAFIASFQNQSSESTIESILKEIDVIKVHATKRLEPENKRLRMEITLADIPSQQRKTKELSAENQRKISVFEIDIERTKLDYDWSKKNNVIAGIAIVSSIDMISNFQSLQIAIPNLLLSIVISLLIVATLSFGLKVIGTEIKSTDNKRKKTYWIIGAFTVASILFYILGCSREKFNAGNSSFFNIPYVWLLFNLVFFTISFIIACRLLPSKEDKLKRRDVLDKITRRNNIVKEDKNLWENLMKEENRVGSLIQVFESRTEYLQMTLMHLDCSGDSIIALYKKECDLRKGGSSGNTSLNR